MWVKDVTFHLSLSFPSFAHRGEGDETKENVMEFQEGTEPLLSAIFPHCHFTSSASDFIRGTDRTAEEVDQRLLVMKATRNLHILRHQWCSYRGGSMVSIAGAATHIVSGPAHWPSEPYWAALFESHVTCTVNNIVNNLL